MVLMMFTTNMLSTILYAKGKILLHSMNAYMPKRFLLNSKFVNFCVEKNKKNLVTSISSFSHNAVYPFQDRTHDLSQSDWSSAHSLSM